MREHSGTGAVQPSVAVGGNPRPLHVGDQLSALVVGHPVAGRGLDERQVVDADHPQCATHREMLDERAPLVQGAVQVGHCEAG